MTKVLVTGSSGFVGNAVAARLAMKGVPLVRAVREVKGVGDEVAVGSIGSTTDWHGALEGCTSVIHIAAALPQHNATEDEIQSVNGRGTQRLVEQAGKMGIRSVILVSSIAAVAGNKSRETITDRNIEPPSSAYGRSKLAAEKHVADFAADGRSGISLRPPLVYGARAGGNWRLLQKIAATGLPLPFGAVRNRRTLISIDNLADAIVHAFMTAEPSKSGAYAVGDTQSVSLEEILRYLREGMGKPARLLPVPAALMTGALKTAGRGQMADSLLGDLEVDSSRFRDVFGWQPIEGAADGIRKSGREYAAS